MRIRDLETPALVVDRNVMERNLDRMMGLLEGKRPRLRPHYKTHKSTDIALLQIEKGAKGITCSKLSEAEDLARAGIEDILIANQVVQPAKVGRLAFLAGTCHLTVCVDNGENIRALSAAAQSAGTHIHCYIELDIGMKRCGVSDFGTFCQLARLLQELPGVSYDGIQAYAGNLAHDYDRPHRESATGDNESRLRELVAYLKERGIETREVSGGSTGTAYLKAESTVYTEIQAGSFIFMDGAYGRMNLMFDNALYVAATVVSCDEEHFVIDAGIKSLAVDQGLPSIADFDCADVNMSEEHATFYGSHDFQLGDMVMVIPGHCCATVNLYDQMYFTSGDQVIDRIPVVSRGKAQ